MSDASLPVAKTARLTRTFLFGLAGALTAAWLFPSWGAKGGALHADVLSSLGIMLIFFLQGVSLPGEQLARSFLAWRLHLFIQVCGLILFPFLTWLLVGGMGSFVPADLRLGFLFLAILPTTISSAVILVTAARGDLAAAIFNTTVSNVLGVFVVPAASVWFLSSQHAATIPFLPLLGKIAQLLLLPLLLGQCSRPWLKFWFERHRPKFSHLNNSIIFFIVYAAFCDTFLSGGLQRHGVSAALWAGCGALILLVVNTSLVWWLSCQFRFDRAARVTALFCACQKTLAAGVPLAGAIFSGTALNSTQDLGLILLPLMFYHPLQLTLGGLMLPWLDRTSSS